MPLIDFKCKECEKEFFEIVKSDGEKPKCPACGSDKVERVYKGKFYGKGGCTSGNCSSCGGGCH